MKVKNTNSINNENLAAYYFHQGTNFYAYDYLGCHLERDGNAYRYSFRVWAPSAHSVELCGDFNSWNGAAMYRIPDTGIWECRLDLNYSIEGNRYKYRVNSNAGSHMKADPYATASETEKNTASIVHTERGFEWCDGAWLKKKKKIVLG